MTHWAIRKREWRQEVEAEIRMLERESQRVAGRLNELREIKRVIFEGGRDGKA